MVWSHSSRLAILPVLLFLAAGLVLPASCQTETASIDGSVADPTGAVVADARVRLVDTDRGLKSEVATGSSGFYRFPNVRPGHYQMEVEKSGFKLLRLTGITLNVQDNLEQNFKLDVGSASETITVVANAVNVNTTGGTVSTVVDRIFAENIPLNGRTFQTLIMLTPGVVVTQTAADDQGQFSVNGQRADANYFMVDGVSANFGVTGYFPLGQTAGGALPALSAQGGTNSLVSVDAMQEFRVQTSSFAPEFGRTPGGQVSIVTRSGTNAFHGTLFEYFRNDVLDANDWFNGYTNNPPLRKAAERQNDFGGVFGGPIIRDKTFFFFSFEGLRLRQPSTQQTVVPDAASRNLQTAAGMAIRPYLNAYPLPNGPELGNGLAQFNAAHSDLSTLNAYSIRLDHAFNSNLSLFGRYNYSPSNSDVRNPYGALSTTQLLSTAVHTFTVGLTGSITPRIINELRANYSNDRVGSRFTLDNFGGAMPVPDSTLFPSGFTSANGLFEILIIGVGEWATGKFATDEQRHVNLIDNLSWSKGSHEFKFGLDYRWLSPFSSPLSYIQFAEFGGVTRSPGGALSGTALFADVAALKNAALLTRNLSFYGQDTWKVSPRLTLTYGLRWEINLPLKGKNSQNQPFTVTGLNNPATMTLAPRGTPLYDTTYGNVAPRVGIAYQLGSRPTWGALLRGGFGIFYDQGYGSLGITSAFFPFNAARIIAPSSCPTGNTGVCFPLSAQNATPPAFSTSPPVVTIVVPNFNLKLPRTYEWNVALEQSLGMSQSLSMTYVGGVGRDLLRTTFLTNPNPNFINVQVTDNTATSNYQALQVKFQRRLSQGLQALTSYTFSHSIDIASTDTFTYLNTPTSIADPSIDRGNSNFDIRHSFSAGVTYSVPTPVWNNVARATLGGWSVDSFIFARSAAPVNVIGGYTSAVGTTLRYRPNVNPGVPLELYGSQYPGGKIFNQAAFTAAPSGQQGEFGRNVLRGFGAVQADIAFQREFQFTERMRLRFRGEFFNIFNHPNFGPPSGDLTSSQFGFSTATLASSLGSGGPNGGLNPLYQIGGPRSIQLALKLQF
jgi:Carboxypeptidase regulatory-like domain/TonB dependent receptor